MREISLLQLLVPSVHVKMNALAKLFVHELLKVGSWKFQLLIGRMD